MVLVGTGATIAVEDAFDTATILSSASTKRWLVIERARVIKVFDWTQQWRPSPLGSETVPFALVLLD